MFLRRTEANHPTNIYKQRIGFKVNAETKEWIVEWMNKGEWEWMDEWMICNRHANYEWCQLVDQMLANM